MICQERQSISIHALLAESDFCQFRWVFLVGNFYPRSPCGERPFVNCNSNFTQKFLSTLSLRRATRWTSSKTSRQIFLSTLSLRRATRYVSHMGSFAKISIHALLAESDLRVLDGSKSSIISIHALLAESDAPCAGGVGGSRDFYPRSPCGERPLAGLWVLLTQIFLSTLSLRRATVHALKLANAMLFLSTLSLRRATTTKKVSSTRLYVFLSTLSLRRATSHQE